MLTNTSGLKPLGRAVLVRMIEIEEMKASLIQIPQHVKQNSAMMETRAEVIEIGASCWEDEREPRAKIGDKVIITRMAGYAAIGDDKEIYRLVNDRDIFCRIEKGVS